MFLLIFSQNIKTQQRGFAHYEQKVDSLGANRGADNNSGEILVCGKELAFKIFATIHCACQNFVVSVST